MKKEIDKNVISILKSAGVGILPTDTIYGIVGSALSKETVERIYKLRKRNKKKPMIILIGSFADLGIFNIKANNDIEKVLKRFWPGKVSIVFECDGKNFEYLHRGKKSLAFRFAKEKWLLDVLKKTGPLVAPSANFEGQMPAKNIKEAKKYFEDKVDFYVDFGNLSSKASKIIKLNEKGEVEVLRK